MDEFNADIHSAPARKSDVVRRVKVKIFDKKNTDKDYITKETRTAATIKKHSVVFDVASGRLCYGSNNCTSWCCSQESRLNAERAYFKRNYVNTEIREAFQ